MTTQAEPVTCQCSDEKCTSPATMEYVLGKLEDHSTVPPQLLCSLCGARLQTVHGVFPEESPASPFRVVRVRLLEQPAVHTPSPPPTIPPYPQARSV